MKCDEIFAALAMLEKERGISQAFMMDKIVQALTTAYKRDHEGVENVVVDVDEGKRELKMFVQKEVVDEVENPGTQMSLDDAKAISAKYNVGDIVNIPVDNIEFGRIAAGNGKQVIIQGLREAESGMVYDEYNSKQHEILTGVVTRIDPRTGNASLRIGTGTEATDAILLAGEQVKGETLIEGQRIKVYLVDVRRQSRGPQVVISRTHPGLVKRLFELEVPEIYDGTVEIRSIAREAGSRTKMAVWSNDENVDPIGACVGPHGQRVNSIVEELRGEKIDIIKYSDDPAEYIAAALAPADVAPLIVGAVKNGVPAVEHVRFPLDGEWKYYGSSNEYIMYDVDVVADELHEYIYNDVTPGTAASSGSDGSTDSDDPADNTTGTSSPAAGSHKTETVDPESLVEDGGSYDASTGDYYDSDGDRYYLDENGNRVYY